jgi:hypothetical protein
MSFIKEVTMARTMKAVVLSEPGPVENLSIVELPVPEPDEL